MRKIKVLYIFNHLRYGGAEVGLLTTLKNLKRNSFDWTVVSLEKKGAIGEEIEQLGAKVIYLNSEARLFNLFLVKKIVEILNKEKPDIVHTSLFYANFFGRIASLFKASPVVIAEERSMYTEKRVYHVIIDRVLSYFTDKIIVCSNSVLNFTVKQEGIKKDKFCLLYNAVDAERFDIPQTKEELRREYGFQEEQFIIGTVGSLIPKKGHRFLLEAMYEVCKDIPAFKLLVIGEGGCEKELRDLVKSRNMGDKVEFLGARKDVPQFMKMMDIFVLASLQEGFPRTLIEAMYAGLPVIASNISGIPEIISHRENGFLIPPGDPAAIRDSALALYRDSKLLLKMGVNARRKIMSGYLPGQYVQKLEQLYLRLLERKGA